MKIMSKNPKNGENITHTYFCLLILRRNMKFLVMFHEIQPVAFSPLESTYTAKQILLSI